MLTFSSLSSGKHGSPKMHGLNMAKSLLVLFSPTFLRETIPEQAILGETTKFPLCRPCLPHMAPGKIPEAQNMAGTTVGKALRKFRQLGAWVLINRTINLV